MYYPVKINNENEIKKLALDKCKNILTEELKNNPKRLLVFNRLQAEDFLSIKPLHDCLQEMNLIEHVFGISISLTVRSQSIIHTDPKKLRYSLNIPILNCEKTYLSFFSCINKEYDTKNFEAKHYESDGVLSTQKTQYDVKEYNKKDCQLIGKYECIESAIIDTQVPHMFDNYNHNARIMLLVRLKTTANQLVEKYSTKT